MNAFDFHIHTNRSDGSEGIEEIIDLARKQKVGVIALTDHDYYHQDIPTCEDLTILRAIEVSTTDEDTMMGVHILGYGFDQYPELLMERAANHLTMIREISEQQVIALQKAKYDITLLEVEKKARCSTSIYKQHIMSVLIDKGYTTDLYGELYRKLFKQGGICERKGRFSHTGEIIQLIELCGGVAVVAHPCVSGCLEQTRKYVSWGLRGIESYHSAHDQTMVDACHFLARKYGLIETGGSDFHGSYGNEPLIGDFPSMKRESEVLQCFRNG